MTKFEELERRLIEALKEGGKETTKKVWEEFYKREQKWIDLKNSCIYRSEENLTNILTYFRCHHSQNKEGPCRLEDCPREEVWE
jgi:hypothetical protein